METASAALLTASRTALDELSGLDTFVAIAPCAMGGLVDASVSPSASVNGDILLANFDMDMTLIDCGFHDSTMNGAIRHEERYRIDQGTNSVGVSGSTQGSLTFAGALMGPCSFDIDWTLDTRTLAFDVEGRACGRAVSLTIDSPPPASDPVWDEQEAMTVADSVFHIGDFGRGEVDREYRDAPSPVDVDMTAQCSLGRSMAIMGHRTEILDAGVMTTTYELILVVTDCDAGSPPASGTIEYREVEQFDVGTGEGSTATDILGELTFADAPWPDSPCRFALHREINHATGAMSLGGTACGHEISFSLP